MAEQFTVQVDAGHRHDLPRLDFGLEQRAVDGHVANIGVKHGHQVQRLDHVRAVLAGQREIGLEVEFAFEVLNLGDHILGQLGRMAAHLQQGQYQGGELVAHRQAGETQADIAVRAIEGKRRLAAVAAISAQSDFVAQADDVIEQTKQLFGFRAVIEGSDDLERQNNLFKVSLQLGFKSGVQHDCDSYDKFWINKRPDGSRPGVRAL